MRGSRNQYIGDESIDFFKLNTQHANLIADKVEVRKKKHVSDFTPLAILAIFSSILGVR